STSATPSPRPPGRTACWWCAPRSPTVSSPSTWTSVTPGLQEGDGHWSGYVRTVADRLDANFPGRVRGADLTVPFTLPLAAGMSSSSALVVGLALCLIDLSEIAADPAFTSEITSPEQLGEYLGTVENGQSFGALAGHRGVGTFGGSEDHTAMLCAVPD